VKAPGDDEPSPVLETIGLRKSYGTTAALDGIDLRIYAGEVHAMLGGNGAGKSTLLRLLFGLGTPSAGRILMDGRQVSFRSPRDGRRAGIGMVFQTFPLIPALRVWENIALFLPRLPFVVGRERLSERIREVSETYNLPIHPDARVGSLAMGERQKVEIIKMLMAGARILIFDEPTSVLAPHEVDGLFETFRRLSEANYAVLFASQKLIEALRNADRVTVLRQGRIDASFPAAQAARGRAIHIVIGPSAKTPNGERSADSSASRRKTGHGRSAVEPDEVIRFSKVTCMGDSGLPGIEEASFHVAAGEVLGVAGASGNGQELLGDLIIGIRSASAGAIVLQGRELVGPLPSATLDRDLSVPAWWLANEGVGEPARGASPTAMHLPEANPVVRGTRATADDLQPPEPGPGFSRNPLLVIAYYLTRRLDIATAATARKLIRLRAAAGCAVLLVCEDLDELFAVVDRFVVFHRGRIVGTFRPSETDQFTVELLMTAGHL